MSRRAEVAADLVRLKQRHVEQLSVLILHYQHFAADSAAFERLEAAEDTDTVVEMDRIIPLVEIGQRKFRHPDRLFIGGGCRCDHIAFAAASFPGESGVDQLTLSDRDQLFGRDREARADAGRFKAEIPPGKAVSAAPGFQHRNIVGVRRQKYDPGTLAGRLPELFDQQLAAQLQRRLPGFARDQRLRSAERRQHVGGNDVLVERKFRRVAENLRPARRLPVAGQRVEPGQRGFAGIPFDAFARGGWIKGQQPVVTLLEIGEKVGIRRAAGGDSGPPDHPVLFDRPGGPLGFRSETAQ